MALLNTHSSSSSDHSGLNCSLQIGQGVALAGSAGARTHLRLRAARRSVVSLVFVTVSGLGSLGPASLFSWIQSWV